jgi:hypothetical protein
LFHPYDASGERGRWKKTWERAGPKFMRTDEEKKKHEDKKKKQERKDLRDRLHKMLHPYSKKSKEAKRKAQLTERRSVGSVAASSAAAAGRRPPRPFRRAHPRGRRGRLPAARRDAAGGTSASPAEQVPGLLG